MDDLSIRKIYLRGTDIDDQTLNKIIVQSSFDKIEKLGLSYNDQISNQTIKNITDRKTPLNLKCLEIDSTSIDDEGVELLAFSECFKNLKELDLSDSLISVESIDSLSQPSAHPRLTLFKYENTNITDSFVLSLYAMNENFSGLKTLSMTNLPELKLTDFNRFCKKPAYSLSLQKLALKQCQLTTEHIRVLCQAKSLARLESLDISENFLDDSIIPYFCRARFLPTLKDLILIQNKITTKFIKSLTKTSCYQNLEGLNLMRCPKLQSMSGLGREKTKPFKFFYLGDIAVKQRDLTRFLSRHFVHLQKLKLRNLRGKYDWAVAIKGLKGVARLEVLKLQNVGIPNEVLKILFSQVEFSALGKLKLTKESGFNGETLKILCNSCELPKLHFLNLKDNGLCDEDLDCITESKNFPLLKGLNFENNLDVSKEYLSKMISCENLSFLEVIVYERGEIINRLTSL